LAPDPVTECSKQRGGENEGHVEPGVAQGHILDGKANRVGLEQREAEVGRTTEPIDHLGTSLRKFFLDD